MFKVKSSVIPFMASTNNIDLPPKPLSRIERTKSFLKASLIKKWKSSKELFTKPLANFGNSDNNNASTKAARKAAESSARSAHYIHDKSLDSLDDFERNFLLSAGRKILVRELRKNFEKPTPVQNVYESYRAMDDLSYGPRPPSTNYACQPSSNNTTTASVVTAKPVTQSTPRKFSDACIQTIPDYKDQKAKSPEYEIISAWESDIGRKRVPIVSRHSFYNTYRNEYCTSENNHYDSNLSLISCGITMNTEKTLERTISKYRNSIKSSSAVDLSSISTVVLNTAAPMACDKRANGSKLRRHYSSIVNISHTNSSESLNDMPIIEYTTNDRAMDTYATVIRPSYSTKSLNTLPMTETIYDSIKVR